MEVLVIGGTVFLGRAVVAQAQHLGARVTTFNRGVSGTAPPGVTHLRGDRTVAADLEQLRGRHFDVVVDTCGYVPAEVTLSAELLAGSAGHYAFVSSISAYPGWPAAADYHAAGPWDGDPDATRGDVPTDLHAGQAYGWLKVGCERAVVRAFGPQRCAVLRAGAIVGPDDSAIGRLPWWIARIARGGGLLVPGTPDNPIALIDSRDLAAFALSGATGTFECGGPAGRDTWGDLLDACRSATRPAPDPSSEAPVGVDERWLDERWLVEQGVEPWTELPLWIPADQGPGLWRHDNSAAVAAGLTWRPLAQTVRDTWVWMQALPQPWRPAEPTPGLAPDRERQLLAAWSQR